MTRAAIRLAISVLPTPVGPIIMMFFGSTSSRSSSESWCLRHRFLMAIATARLAFFCPIMYLSSSSTILRGVNSSTLIFLLVYTQMSAAIFRASSTISFAFKEVCFTNALAAAIAYEPPEPIPIMPSSGSITSPPPEIKKEYCLSTTTSSDSNLLSTLSVRHSLANS